MSEGRDLYTVSTGGGDAEGGLPALEGAHSLGEGAGEADGGGARGEHEVIGVAAVDVAAAQHAGSARADVHLRAGDVGFPFGTERLEEPAAPVRVRCQASQPRARREVHGAAAPMRL